MNYQRPQNLNVKRENLGRHGGGEREINIRYNSSIKQYQKQPFLPFFRAKTFIGKPFRRSPYNSELITTLDFSSFTFAQSFLE